MKKLAMGLILAGLTTSLFCGCARTSNPAAPLSTTAASVQSQTESEDGLDYSVPMDLEEATVSENLEATASETVEAATSSVEATTSAPVVTAKSDLVASITSSKVTGYFSWKKLEITVQVRNPYFYRRSGLLKISFRSQGNVVETLAPVELQLGAAEIRNYTYRSTVLADEATVSVDLP